MSSPKKKATPKVMMDLSAGGPKQKRSTPAPRGQSDPVAARHARYVAVRAQARTMKVYLNGNCPDSRELSLALTKLEECLMWANAAIGSHEI